MIPDKELFNNEDKLKAIAFCKEHINSGNDGGNGYCSLHFAAVSACPDKTWKDMDHMRAFFKSISSLMIQNGEYIISKEYPDGNNFDIAKNPNYKTKKYFERHQTQEKLLLALVSAVIGGCVTLAISTYNNRSQRKTDYLQDQQIKELKDSVNNLIKALKLKH